MKSGVTYFPLDCEDSNSLQLIEAEFGIKGFAVIVKLYQCIYSNGYYCEFSKDSSILFARKCAAELQFVLEVVKCAIRRKIFDKVLFDKYRILTSEEIQSSFFLITKRRINQNFVAKYIITKLPILENVNNLSKDVNKFDKNVNTSIPNKDDIKNLKKDIYYNKIDDINAFMLNIKRFNIIINNSIDYVKELEGLPIKLDKLLAEINNSKYLQIAQLDWIISNHDKILSGAYRSFEVKKPSKHNMITHEYTENEINNIYSDLENFDNIEV